MLILKCCMIFAAQKELFVLKQTIRSCVLFTDCNNFYSVQTKKNLDGRICMQDHKNKTLVEILYLF